MISKQKLSESSLPITTFVLSFLILFNSFLFAQQSRINFSHLLSQNGLSQNTIHCVLQDKKGFIWIATEDGLDRYDGYNFKVYKNNSLDSTSISDNFIWTLFEDKDGFLWVGTNSGGLCKFDSETEKFTTYRHDPGNPNSLNLNNVRTIFEDSDRNLWVGTEGGLNKLNKKTNVFTHYYNDPNDPNSLSNNVVLSIFEDRSGDLWIGSDGGLDMYDKQNDKFINYSKIPGDKNSLSNNVVLSIYEDIQGYLWIGTLNGANRFDKKRKKFTRFLANPVEGKIAINNTINSIIEDKTDLLWIGTGDGFYQLHSEKNTNNGKPPALTKSDILNHNNILYIYEDNAGIIWIGTAEDGVVKYDRERIKFRHYKHDPFDPNSLSHNTVRSIYQDNNDVLWVGTLGGGLNRFDPSRKQFFYYKNDPDDKFSLSDNSISAIYKDDYGYLWVGTWSGGLNRSVRPHKTSENFKFKFINFKNDPSQNRSISSSIIQSIFEDSDKNLWIGTGVGLDLYNRGKNNFISFQNIPGDPQSLSSNQVQSCIIEDKNGNLWIGTWEGLSKISSDLRKNALKKPGSVKFVNYRTIDNDNFSLSDDRVISAYEDEEGNMWFGTYGGGINKLTPDQQNSSKPRFINYTTADGLASNIIYGIEGDGNNNLWLSTDNGLSLLNYETDKIQNYDASDGLQGNQFYWGASFKGRGGELFFGGTNGFNAFFPGELKVNNHIPPIVITDFQIFNKPVKISGDNSPLKKSISYTKKIELSYSQNVFSFEFAALDFAAPGKNLYAYKMEGFDNNWINSGKRRFVTYTNLDPGDYIFRVKGSNNDGIWNNEGTSITLTILPPLWRRWWFILSVSLLLIGLVVYIVAFRIRNLLAIERFRTKIAADLHDNIGSSLTEISILSEVISHKIKSEDASVIKSLKLISNNSRNLIDGMSDIVWLVNPKRDSLYDLILRLRDTYAELSTYTDISFKSENIKELEKVSLSMEHRQHLFLIFKEAINNSITHSNCSEITLEASVKGKRLEMTVRDNGAGFEIKKMEKGNGLNNMKERAKSIGGELEIITGPDTGTTIKFIGNIL